MSDLTVSKNIEQLVEEWLQAERNGVQFPVPFDMAWPMAGYSRKDSAKRNGLKGLVKEEHYSTKTWNKPSSNASGVSRSELIELSMAGFEHLCLMADTPEGKAVRELYRQAKAKWDIVQKIAPEFAQEVEILRLKAEISKNEAIARQAEQKTIELRHYVVTALPEHVQQKVLGYSVVEKVEYRDRVLLNEDVVRDGTTISRTEVCKRLGIMKGKQADCKTLDALLAQLPSDATRLSAVVQEYREVDLQYLPKLAEMWGSADRTLWIGE